MGEFFSTQFLQSDSNQVLSKDEQELLNMYRSLDKNDQKLLLTYTKGFTRTPPKTS